MEEKVKIKQIFFYRKGENEIKGPQKNEENINYNNTISKQSHHETAVTVGWRQMGGGWSNHVSTDWRLSIGQSRAPLLLNPITRKRLVVKTQFFVVFFYCKNWKRRKFIVWWLFAFKYQTFFSIYTSLPTQILNSYPCYYQLPTLLLFFSFFYTFQNLVD